MLRLATLCLILIVQLPNNLKGQQQILIPMDVSQTDHLKAYGIIFNHIEDGFTAKWLLNYRGGSFMVVIENDIVRKSLLRLISLWSSHI